MANPLKLEVIFNGTGNLLTQITGMTRSTKKLQHVTRSTQAELSKLGADQRNIDRYRRLRSEMDKTNDELTKHKAIIADLNSKANLAPLKTKEAQALAKAERQVAKLTASYQDQANILTKNVQSLHQSGIKVESLAHDEAQLKTRIVQTTLALDKRKTALDKATKAQDQYAKTQNMLNTGKSYAQQGLMVAGAGAVAMTVPAKLSIDFESSMANVAKVVDGLRDEAGKVTPAYAKMSKEIIDLSTRLPMAANDIATIVAAGGQSGIAANELIKFAESAVKMGVAFDISADEAGQAMAEMRTAFRMNQTQVTTLADQINYLGNNTPAAAKGIMDIVKRVGPLGEVSGYASGSIAALGATLRGMGVQEEIAATGIQNFMLSLVAGESATKAQRAAFQELGFESAQVAKDMQADAEATTLKILQAVKKLPKDEQAAMLQTLFGKESIKAIAPLLNNMDALEANFIKVGDASKYAGSMEKEYAARAATTANNLTLLKNKASALGVTMGNALLPSINKGADAIGAIFTKVRQWADANPSLAGTLTKIVVGLILFVGGLSALALVLTTVLAPLAFLKMTLGTLGGSFALISKGVMLGVSAVKMLGTVFMTVGRMMLANPILLAITAIAVAAYLIYKNWEPIKAFFADIWQSLKVGVNSAITTIKTAFNGGIQGISALILNWSPIGLFYKVFAKVMSYFGVELPSSFTGFGRMIIDGLIKGIQAGFAKLKSIWATVSSFMPSFLKKKMDIHSPSRVMKQMGGHIMGGLNLGLAQGHPAVQKQFADTTGLFDQHTKPHFADTAPVTTRGRSVTVISQDKVDYHISVQGETPIKQLIAELDRREQEKQQIMQRRFKSYRDQE